MPIRRDPVRDHLDLTANQRHYAIQGERERSYAASRFTKKLFSYIHLTKSSQFGMDARPNPVLPPFRLRRCPSAYLWGFGSPLAFPAPNPLQDQKGFGIFALNLCAKSPE